MSHIVVLDDRVLFDMTLLEVEDKTKLNWDVKKSLKSLLSDRYIIHAVSDRPYGDFNDRINSEGVGGYFSNWFGRLEDGSGKMEYLLSLSDRYNPLRRGGKVVYVSNYAPDMALVKGMDIVGIGIYKSDLHESQLRIDGAKKVFKSLEDLAGNMHSIVQSF